MVFVLKKERLGEDVIKHHVIENKIDFVRTCALLFNITTTNTNSKHERLSATKPQSQRQLPVCFAISLPRLKNKRQAKPSIS
jgi:hypothetical protein